MSDLVQVTRQRGVVSRVPRDQEPVIELQLEPNQTILDMRITQDVSRHERITVDYRWSCLVATRFRALGMES